MLAAPPSHSFPPNTLGGWAFVVTIGRQGYVVAALLVGGLFTATSAWVNEDTKRETTLAVAIVWVFAFAIASMYSAYKLTSERDGIWRSRETEAAARAAACDAKIDRLLKRSGWAASHVSRLRREVYDLKKWREDNEINTTTGESRKRGDALRSIVNHGVALAEKYLELRPRNAEARTQARKSRHSYSYSPNAPDAQELEDIRREDEWAYNWYSRMAKIGAQISGEKGKKFRAYLASSNGGGVGDMLSYRLSLLREFAIEDSDVSVTFDPAEKDWKWTSP